MSYENSLNAFFDQNEDVDIKRKIVEQLLNNENLSSKTELAKPLRWSCLDTIREYVEKHELKRSNEILNKFIETSFTFLISNERKGRAEYIEALKSLANIDKPPQMGVNPLNPVQPK